MTLHVGSAIACRYSSQLRTIPLSADRSAEGLMPPGYEVETVENGKKVIKVFRNDLDHLVICIYLWKWL